MHAGQRGELVPGGLLRHCSSCKHLVVCQGHDNEWLLLKIVEAPPGSQTQDDAEARRWAARHCKGPRLWHRLSCPCLCHLGLSPRWHQAAPSCCPAEADAAPQLLPCQMNSLQTHLGRAALAHEPARIGAQPSPHVADHLIDRGSNCWDCPGLPQRQLTQTTQLLVGQVPVCPKRSSGAYLSKSGGQRITAGFCSVGSPTLCCSGLLQWTASLMQCS